MPFAATGPQSFIESMRLSGNDDLLGRAVQAAGCPYRRASASAPPWGGQEAQAERTPSCPWFRAPGWAAQVSLQQVLDKTDAVVLKHHTIAFLSCVEIDIGANGKIMVTIGVAKGLLHMPHMPRFLIGFVDSQKRH